MSLDVEVMYCNFYANDQLMNIGLHYCLFCVAASWIAVPWRFAVVSRDKHIFMGNISI